MKLDYSALNQPVHQADIDTYQIVYGETGFRIPKAVRVVGMIFVGVLVAISVVSTVAGRGEFLLLMPQLFIGIVLVVAFTQASQSKIKRRAKIYKFALMNEAQYIAGAQEPEYGGAIFNYAKPGAITEAIVLPDGTEIGNYMYVVGRGKSSTECHWGYVRVKLNRRLPHILLDAKSNDIFGKLSNLPQSFRGQTMSLEGDFDKYFTLYVPADYQRDALYILTPDVMSALIDFGKDYDIEIVDDELFIFGPVLDLTLQSTIESLVNTIDVIGGELRAQTNRYSDERVSDRAANIVAEPGRRMKKHTSATKVITSVAAAAIILYFIISANKSYFVNMFIK